MKSILVSDTQHCIFCNNPNVEGHHIYFGLNRKVADKYKLIVPLCNKHHTGGADSPHMNRIIDLLLKSWGQSVYEREIGDRNQFIREFGRSYL